MYVKPAASLIWDNHITGGGEMAIVVGRRGATLIWNAEKRMDACQSFILVFSLLSGRGQDTSTRCLSF